MRPSLTFCLAQPGDADALADLRVEAMRESLERIGRFDQYRARQRFLASFSPAQTHHIVLGTDRVGFFVLKVEATHLLLDHLYIRPSRQGRGFGAEVLRWVFREAELACLPVWVGALRGSDANRFYVRHGFELVKVAEFDNYYERGVGSRAP